MIEPIKLYVYLGGCGMYINTNGINHDGFKGFVNCYGIG